MHLTQETLNSISKTVENALGMTYEEFDKLDFDQQQELLANYRIINKNNENDEYFYMIVGSDKYSTLINNKNDEEILTSYRNITADLTTEEEQERLDDNLNSIIYSKTTDLVKKLKRKIKK